jgi:hypothetical protein
MFRRVGQVEEIEDDFEDLDILEEYDEYLEDENLSEYLWGIFMENPCPLKTEFDGLFRPINR